MKRKTGGAPAGTFARVLKLTRPEWPLFLLILLLAAASVAGTLAIPLLVGRGIDGMLGPGKTDLAAIGRIALTVACVAAGTGLLQWIMGMLTNRAAFAVVRRLRDRVFDKLQVLPLSFLDRHPVGELTSCMIADIDQLSDGLLMGFTQLFTGVMTILGTLLFMARVRWQIALIVVVLTPLSFLIAGFIARRTYHLFKKQSELRAQQTALVEEYLGQQKVVRAFGQEAQTQEAFDRVGDQLIDASARATFYSSLTNPTTRVVNAVVYAVVAFAGALTVLSGGITVGSLSAFLSYATQYMKPFNEISGVVTELQNALACAARVFALLDEAEEIPDREDAAVLPEGSAAVSVRDVSFSYDPERPLIRGFSMEAGPGQRIAIVGPTGCGKTTVINLLMRFYDVDGGQILVGGTDVRDLTRRSLRAGFGMVLQDTWLRSGTIRENLCMGRPDATEEEMIRAAKAAHAHSFIRRLPNGYDTVIGEDGGGLSQGQKQLLCIARVMLTDPPMLILDEATSSIDIRTEQKVQAAFRELMKGRTSFIVAHRLSTIREADRILVMRDGQLIESGRHGELLAADGFYAKMYRAGYAE